MREYAVFHVDAFTDTPFGGNPAGVVPEADGLSAKEMKQIARELNLSETAFLTPSTHGQADYKVRYFTPTEEIDFCGHATIGLSWVLATQYGWAEKAAQVRLETNIGLVPVDWMKEGETLKAVVMTQVAPQTAEVSVNRLDIARMIGISSDELEQQYPIRLAYTGNWHLLVPVKSRSAVDGALPKWSELEALNRELKVSTTHLFTFDRDEASDDLYTRDFAPAVGIAEDPVTGSANGALAGYLILEGLLSSDQVHQLTIAQGDAMGRPGRLKVTITPGWPVPTIQVGGSAVLTISGKIRL